MRKAILLITALALSLTATAQVKFGIEAGMNLSHYHSHTDYRAKSAGGMGAGFQVSATVDYEFPRHWMLASGLTFLRTQSNMKLTGRNTDLFTFPSTQIKLNHLMIPLKGGYRFQLGKKFSLIPTLGLYASYNFSAGSASLQRLNLNSHSQQVVEHDTWKPMEGYAYPYAGAPDYYRPSIDPCRKWTWGAMAEVKAIIGNHYTASLSYYENLKQDIGYHDIRNFGLMLSVGYRF